MSQNWLGMLTEAGTPGSAGLVVIGMLAAPLHRMVAEWQRRQTLRCILAEAPAGTIVIQGRGARYPAMSVHVGHGVRPPVRPCDDR